MDTALKFAADQSRSQYMAERQKNPNAQLEPLKLCFAAAESIFSVDLWPNQPKSDQGAYLLDALYSLPVSELQIARYHGQPDQYTWVKHACMHG